MTNVNRAERAAHALDAYDEVCDSDQEDRFRDLLTDMMHWAKMSGYDFETELEAAQQHYEAEIK